MALKLRSLSRSELFGSAITALVNRLKNVHHRFWLAGMAVWFMALPVPAHGLGSTIQALLRGSQNLAVIVWQNESKEPQENTSRPKLPPASPEPDEAAERAQTPAEREAAIEEKLRRSLQEFDGLLLKEKELLQEQRADRSAQTGRGQSGAGSGQGEGGAEGQDGNGQDGAGSGRSGSDGASEQGGEDGSDGRGQRANSDGANGEAGDGNNGRNGSEGQSQGKPGRRTGNTGTGPAGGRDARLPPDIPESGKGDDIVARQIREAAMNEEDPELREKLWEEYRKYKGLPAKTKSPAKSGKTDQEKDG